MTYNLRSRGSSHGANVVLVDEYLREWRQAQRAVTTRNHATPTRKSKTPKPVQGQAGNNRLRAVSESEKKVRQNSTTTTTTALRSSRNRTTSEVLRNSYGRRAKSMGVPMEHESMQVSTPVRSRSGCKARRTALDIDMLSESFSARAKIQKLEHSPLTASNGSSQTQGYGSEDNIDYDPVVVMDTLVVVDTFPIQKLPMDCKIKIFSYFSALDKGKASLVCREWNQLMKVSSVWSTVDFTQFELCSRNHDCDNMCYDLYKHRIYNFISMLREVHPALKRLKFHYDIGNQDDCWLECMEEVLEHSNCRELSYAHLDWKETPIRPFWKDMIPWSSEQYKDIMYSSRRRQRKFIRFFEKLVEDAPNISHLILPFDWSYRSVNCISRLANLRVLVLEKYFVFQSPPLSYLDDLLKNCIQLQKLVLEIWTPSGRSMCLYRLCSASIKHLDISQSRGFYLQHLDMPNLESFVCKRHPWNGPLTSSEVLHLPCLYDMLVTGAPNLRKLNDHCLKQEWRHMMYDDLQVLLRKNCSCSAHKTGWAM